MDTNFRRLSKNDLLQTTEQWRERTLQRLGEVSGEWTAWVEQDNIPQCLNQGLALQSNQHRMTS